MKLFFRKYGEGQPLIILHGLFGQSDNWNNIAKILAQQGIQSITVDLRNHGQSPHTSEMNYEIMANDIFELIQSENIPSPIILGHSMGGKVAMTYDYLYPNTLKKIIVVDIVPKKYIPAHTVVFNALNAVDFNLIKNRKDAENILRKYLQDEAIIQFLLKNLYWQTTEKLNWRFNLNAIQEHYESILDSLPFYVSSTNALFLRGGNSEYILDADIPFIRQYYPQAEIITIPNAGHWIHAEQPQLFIERVKQFIFAI